MRTSFSRIVTAVAAATSLALTAAPAMAQTRHHFDVAKQSMGKALNAFAAQAGINIYFDPADVEGLTGPGLKLEGTTEEALARLLEGTPLKAVKVDENTVRVAVDRGSRTSAAASGEPVIRVAEAETVSAEAQSAVSAQNETSGGTGNKGSGVAEVLVTATRREERLMDVPLSVSVFSADEIDRRGLVSSEDYLRGVPGVNQLGSGNGQSIVIRGIETSPYWQNFFSGATAATYFGETPTTNSAGLNGGTNVDLKLVDVQRVEVLRGPQGTAFGSSSMGGAVRTIPVAPKLDALEAKVAAGYSVTSGEGGSNYTGQAIINVPVVEGRVALRAVGYKYEDSGYYNNRSASNVAFQNRVVIPNGVQAFTRDADEIGDYGVTGGRIAALLQATDNLRFTLSYLTQKTETDGIGVANSGDFEQVVLEVAPEHRVRGQDFGRTDTDIDIANALIEYGFGNADLTVSYSHTQSGSGLTYPFTSLGGFDYPWSNNNEGDHREGVAEARIATRFEGPWNVLVGVYHEDLQDDARFNNIWYGVPSSNIFGAAAGPNIGDRHDRRDLTQKAAYGEVSWEIVQDLILTGGVRAYDYERRFRLDTSGPSYGGVRQTDEKVEASGQNFRGNLSYKVAADAMVYAGWSQGFRLGQPQGRLPAALCDLNNDGIVDDSNITLDSTGEVKSDDVDSYEIGTKFAAIDRRLSVSADVFRMNWNGMPVTTHSGAALCRGLGYLANAGEARSEGVEFQASMQIAEPLRVELGGSWIRARLTQDVPGLGAAEGDRLPGSPRVSANFGVQYEFSLAGYRASVRADSIYVGEFYGDLKETLSTKAGDYVKVDAAARVDIGRLNLELAIRNLTNEDAFTFRNTFGGAGDFFGYRLRPRTVGLRAAYTF